MAQSEFIGMLVFGLGALVSIIAPIIKLNSSITALSVTLQNMSDNDNVRDSRLSSHSEQLDDHEKRLTEHEIRIKHLEREDE